MTDFLHNGRILGVTEVKGKNQSPCITHEEMETQSIWQFPHSNLMHFVMSCTQEIIGI